jgi:hypothetical protein
MPVPSGIQVAAHGNPSSFQVFHRSGVEPFSKNTVTLQHRERHKEPAGNDAQTLLLDLWISIILMPLG